MALTTLEARATESALDHAVVDVRRVSRTVKGGRRFRFRATVLVGDRKGRVGLGVEKGKDVQAAVAKAKAAAGKRLVVIPLRGTTIPHAVRGTYGGALVLLKPAPAGAGIIAGGLVRSFVSLIGISDLSSKIMGSHNKLNVTKAALRALQSLKPAQQRVRIPTSERAAEQASAGAAQT